MKKTGIFTSLCLLLVVCFTALSCQKEKVDTKAEGEKLMQTSREWSKAAQSRKVDEILNYWTDDAIVYSAGEAEHEGRDSIRKMVENAMKDPNFKIRWEPKKADVAESGDMGYLLEEVKMEMKDSTGNAQVMHFNGITIWKKQSDGSWKAAVDILSPKK
nr:nuclear transport factor 2 family protein [uncultured Flavobacterium sp.]